MQSIVTPLQAVLTGHMRQIRVKIRASWVKSADPATVYAIVGTSLVDGPNLVQGQSTVITNADLFDYMDESEFGLRVEYDRRLDEPRGGTSHAIADVLLDNITGRFTPNKNATIGTALEARRPFKISMGFIADGTDRLTQIIVGLTSSRPKPSKANKTVDIQIYDYITFIDNANLDAAIYENMRSDRIVEDILVSLGFGSSQYELDTGINTIAFGWFDKDKSAGRRIRDICEAEEAHFYQDENGILRFENRDHYANYPHQTVQRTIDPSDILSDEADESTRIINRAIIIAKPRKVDDSTGVVWTSADIPSVPPSSSITIWPAFYDDQGGQNKLPVKEITTPASTTDYVANSQEDGGGSDLTSDISIDVTNFVESAKMVITNSNVSTTAYLTTLQLRGKAARVTQAIQAVSEDANSINKFEAQEYSYQNDLIQDRTIAQTIADNLKNKYKDPLSRRRIRIPGIPHLQLKDLISVISADAENLIPNPSFEVNLNHWELQTTGGSASVEKARDVGVPDGSYFSKITVTS